MLYSNIVSQWAIALMAPASFGTMRRTAGSSKQSAGRQPEARSHQSQGLTLPRGIGLAIPGARGKKGHRKGLSKNGLSPRRLVITRRSCSRPKLSTNSYPIMTSRRARLRAGCALPGPWLASPRGNNCTKHTVRCYHDAD
jgi:hypothetical protein